MARKESGVEGGGMGGKQREDQGIGWELGY